MTDILSMNKPALEEFLLGEGLKKFRASQIFHYIYKQGILDWDSMNLLPKSDRQVLQDKLPFYIPEIVSRLESTDGTTVKLLLKLHDDQTVETVLMKHDYGNSICISTQVGCAVNCAFCASAKNGFIRNLTVGEMVGQLLAFTSLGIEAIHSIVVMGTGEPFFNYDNVIAFLRLIHEKETYYLGYRNITISTSGIVPRIYDLATEKMPVTLAISLHAPTNELRRTIMPITDKYPIEEIVAAADAYFKATGRQVTYEYILIKGVNSSVERAEQLAQLLGRKNILINVIPINDNYDVGLHRPARNEIYRFISYLQQKGLHVTLRKEMGSNIQAACGQLRIKREKN